MIKLGLGVATLLRESSAKRREAVLGAAFDAGIRHLDTAPTYGLGRGELALEPFLRRHGNAVTVTTKFGQRLSRRSSVAAAIPPPARRLLTRYSVLRNAAKRSFTTGNVESVSVGAAIRSLEESLKRLSREHVDFFLLHDLTVQGDPFEYREALLATGKVHQIGFTGGSEVVSSVPPAHWAAYDVLQSDAASRVGADLHTQVEFRYGCFRNLALAQTILAEHHEMRDRLERELDIPLRTSTDIACLLVWATSDTEAVRVIVGTTNPKHAVLLQQTVGRLPARHEVSASTIETAQRLLARS